MPRNKSRRRIDGTEPCGSCSTEARSKSGTTVGLIDALLAIARVLAPRLEADTQMEPHAVTEALRELGSDPDIQAILLACPPTLTRQNEDLLYERLVLLQNPQRSPEEDARVAELHRIVAGFPNYADNSPEDQPDRRFRGFMMDFLRDINNPHRTNPEQSTDAR